MPDIIIPTTTATVIEHHIAALPALLARLVNDGTLDEVVEARHWAEAIRAQAKRCRLGMDAQNAVAVARIWLEYRLGELLAKKVVRHRPKTVDTDDPFRLAAARAQRIAAIPRSQIEAYIAKAHGE